MKKAMSDLSLKGQEGRKNIQMEKDPDRLYNMLLLAFTITHKNSKKPEKEAEIPEK